MPLNPVQIAQLVSELERLVSARLSHPGLAAPMAAGADPAGVYLVQEFVPADSLDALIRSQGRTGTPRAAMEDVVRLTEQLADALDAAADVGIVGGAFHPRDVLLVSDDMLLTAGEARPAAGLWRICGLPRITGLGVAPALERLGVHAPIRRPYTAPERLAGTAWDRRADVFSLAAIVHELLCGRRITGAADVNGVAPNGLHETNELTGANSDLLRTAFARALAGNPSDRFPAARDFASALRAAIPDAEAEAFAWPPVVGSSEPGQSGSAEDVSTEGFAELRTEASTEGSVEGRDQHPMADLSFGAEPRLGGGSAVLGEGSVEVGSDPAEGPAVAPRFETIGEPIGDFEIPLAEPSSTAEAEAPRSHQQTPSGILLGLDDDSPQSRMSEDVPVRSPRSSLAAGARTGRAGEASGRPVNPSGVLGLEGGQVPEPLRRTESAMWPLALALLVGLAVGFAGGYGLGSRERTAGTPESAASVSSVGTAAVAGREHESAVDRETSPAGSAGSMPGTASTSNPAPPSGGPNSGGRAAGSSESVDRAAKPSAPARLGRLLIRSLPTGARVFVDGRERGRSPALVKDLTRGDHRVRLVREGYETDERRVSITGSAAIQPLTVRLARARPLEAHPAAPTGRQPGPNARPGAQNSAAGTRAAGIGSLVVESRPVGVTVLVDGKPVGVTPLVLPQIPAGEHLVRLEQTGYRAWSSTIRIVSGERNRVTGSLEEKY